MKKNGEKTLGKGIMISLLIIAGLGIVGIGMASAAPTVSIDPQSTTGLSPGDTFSIDVAVNSDAYNLKACTIDLTYNASALTATGVTEGTLLGSPTLTEPGSGIKQPGWIHYGITRTAGNTPVPSAGTFITVDFTVNDTAADDVYVLDLSNVELISEGTTAIPGVDVNDGTATVGEAPADEEAPTVTVTSPDGGESWMVGTQQDITWDADDNVNVTAIDISYSTDGGATYPNTIKTDEANDGTYTWTIPDDPSTTCRVKVVAHDAAGNTGEDASDANFTIPADGEDPTVTVTSPDGGESWKKGSTQYITWDADDNVAVTAIDISYSTDGGTTYTDIATDEDNDGTYTWTVPSTLSKTCRVKVVAYDAAGRTGEDVSNADFEIRKVSVGGGRGTPRDTDGDGYTDIQEMLAGTDKNDPCDPDPECAACIATKPAATPTPTPTPTVTPTPTIPSVVTTPTPTPTPTPTEEPGFEAVFAIAGLLAVAYLVLRRKSK